MAWRDTLRDATFRGVGFKVDSHDTEVGRRTVTHVYPQRDGAFVEDMGRRPQVYSFDAYIIGEDYTAARDALLKACEQEGAGQLVHPYLGARTVICTAARLRETKDEGGMARFGLSFEETTDPAFPIAAASSGDAVADAGETLADSAGEHFEKTHNLVGYPQFLADSATSIVQDLTAQMDSLLAPVVSTTENLAALKASVDGLYLDAATLVRTPGVLFTRMRATFNSIGNLPDLSGRSSNAAGRYRALRGLAGFGADLESIEETTSTREQQAANQAALAEAIRTLALVEACNAGLDLVQIADAGDATPGQFDSLDGLVALRDELADLLDDRMDVATDDQVFQALMALRARVTAAIPGEASDISRVVTFTPVATTPALVLAHLLYADASRVDELVARNNIRNPLAVLGGRPVKALANAN